MWPLQLISAQLLRLRKKPWERKGALQQYPGRERGRALRGRLSGPGSSAAGPPRPTVPAPFGLGAAGTTGRETARPVPGPSASHLHLPPKQGAAPAGAAAQKGRQHSHGHRAQSGDVKGTARAPQGRLPRPTRSSRPGPAPTACLPGQASSNSSLGPRGPSAIGRQPEGAGRNLTPRRSCCPASALADK